MNPAFEPALAALETHWQATCSLSLNANATAGSVTLADVSNFSGLFEGLPVFGPGVVRGATIAELNAQAATLTLSDPVAATGANINLVVGFQTVSRRLKHWGEVKAQPALFLRRIGATDDYGADSFFSVTTIEAEGWIYCAAGQDPNLAPDTGLTALEQMVRQSLAPDSDYGDPRFTLGGLAYWCRIEGRTDASPGDQGGQAISKLPIRITLP